MSINYRRECENEVIQRRSKDIIYETKSFYTLLLITIALLIATSIYCYLIKYKAKQKHL